MSSIVVMVAPTSGLFGEKKTLLCSQGPRGLLGPRGPPGPTGAPVCIALLFPLDGTDEIFVWYFWFVLFRVLLVLMVLKVPKETWYERAFSDPIRSSFLSYFLLSLEGLQTQSVCASSCKFRAKRTQLQGQSHTYARADDDDNELPYYRL